MHRLDRQTGGVLLFALDTNINSLLQQQFMNYEVQKTYLTLVRGFTEDEGSIDYALKTDKGTVQEAISDYTTLRRFEVPIALGKFTTSRYSLVQVKPKTGRTHQIRRHFAHIAHPIIGDRRHGCHRQNNLFRDHDLLGLETMLLHASSLTFTHPVTKVEVSLQAELQTPFQAIVDKLGDMSVPSDLLSTAPPIPSPLPDAKDSGDCPRDNTFQSTTSIDLLDDASSSKVNTVNGAEEENELLSSQLVFKRQRILEKNKLTET